MKIMLMLTVAVVAGSVIFGCAEMNDEEAGPVNGTAEVDVNLELEIAGGEFYFEPDDLTVKAGAEIRIVFTNEGGAAHDLVIDDIGRTEIIGPGETDSFVFTVPEGEDSLVFYCSIGQHREHGMEGKIEIVDE